MADDTCSSCSCQQPKYYLETIGINLCESSTWITYRQFDDKDYRLIHDFVEWANSRADAKILTGNCVIELSIKYFSDEAANVLADIIVEYYTRNLIVFESKFSKGEIEDIERVLSCENCSAKELMSSWYARDYWIGCQHQEGEDCGEEKGEKKEDMDDKHNEDRGYSMCKQDSSTEENKSKAGTDIRVKKYPDSDSVSDIALFRNIRGIIFHSKDNAVQAVGQDENNESIVRPLNEQNKAFLAGINCPIDDSLVNEAGKEGIGCKKFTSLLMSTDKKVEK